MGIISEITGENDAQFIVKKIKEKIEEHKNSPETVMVLKNLGIEVLDEFLYTTPDWAQEYYKLFRS